MPAAVAVDLDRLDVVAVRVEAAEHGPRRGNGDLVLARPPARDHRDTDPLRAQGVVGVFVVVGVVVVCVVSVC